MMKRAALAAVTVAALVPTAFAHAQDEERLRERLAQLEAEYEAGQEMLADLDAKREELQQTLLRIDGAIEVLQELLDTPSGDDPIAEVEGSGAE